MSYLGEKLRRLQYVRYFRTLQQAETLSERYGSIFGMPRRKKAERLWQQLERSLPAEEPEAIERDLEIAFETMSEVYGVNVEPVFLDGFE